MNGKISLKTISKRVSSLKLIILWKRLESKVLNTKERVFRGDKVSSSF